MVQVVFYSVIRVKRFKVSGRDCQPAPLPAPEDWSKDGKLREQMWPEEAQIDGSWMQNDPRVPWLMEILRKELKHKKFF